MAEDNCDVAEFNTHARQLLNAYYANKREMCVKEVLLQNLFEAFATCQDRSFVLYVQWKEQEHIDGIAVTPDALMDSERTNRHTAEEVDGIEQQSSESQAKI
jgi:hypothetical protein